MALMGNLGDPYFPIALIISIWLLGLLVCGATLVQFIGQLFMPGYTCAI